VPAATISWTLLLAFLWQHLGQAHALTALLGGLSGGVFVLGSCRGFKPRLVRAGLRARPGQRVLAKAAPVAGDCP
jgi:hypothetical protein